MADMAVSSRGQVVIPADIRKEMDIREGDVLQAMVEDGRLVITPKRRSRDASDAVARTAGLLAGMTVTGAGYVEEIRRGGRLDEIEDRS